MTIGQGFHAKSLCVLGQLAVGLRLKASFAREFLFVSWASRLCEQKNFALAFWIHFRKVVFNSMPACQIWPIFCIKRWIRLDRKKDINPLPAVHTWIRRTRRIRIQRQLRVCFECTCWLTGFDLLQLCSSFRGSKKKWLVAFDFSRSLRT